MAHASTKRKAAHKVNDFILLIDNLIIQQFLCFVELIVRNVFIFWMSRDRKREPNASK